MEDNTEGTPLLSERGNSSSETKKPTWHQRIIYLSIFFMAFGMSLCSYVLYEWTHHKTKKGLFPNTTFDLNTTCGSTDETNPNYKKNQLVQQQSASWAVKYSLAEYIPMLFMQLMLLSYSDMIGRKPLLFVTFLSIILKSGTLTVIIGTHASLWYIVGVNVFEGLMGGSFGLFVTVYSYIADITGKKQRSVEIVILDATALVAVICGAMTSGYAVQSAMGYFYTSMLSTGLLTLGFLILFILPESLPRDKRAKSGPKMLTMVKRMASFYVSREFSGKRLSYILLLLAYLFLSLSGMNRSTLETIYLLGPPFCWEPKNIGHFMLLRNSAQGIIGLGSVKLLKMWFTENSIGIMSMMSCTGSLVLEAVARTTLVMFFVPVVGVFSFLVVAMIRSMMSSMTSPDKQGALFTSVAFIEVLSTILSSVSENLVYSITMSFMNGFVFLLLALFAFFSMMMLVLLRCTSRRVHLPSSNVN